MFTNYRLSCKNNFLPYILSHTLLCCGNVLKTVLHSEDTYLYLKTGALFFLLCIIESNIASLASTDTYRILYRDDKNTSVTYLTRAGCL